MRSLPEAGKVLLPSFEEMMDRIAGAKLQAEGPGALLLGLEGPEYEEQAESWETGFYAAEEEGGEPEDELSATEDICQNMRRAASEEARQILEQAREEAGALARIARETETARARQELDAQRQELREAALGAVEALQKARENLYAALEPYLLDTALNMAESILKYEMDRGNEIYISIVRNVLDHTSASEQIALHLPPGRFETLASLDNAFAAEMAKRGVEIKRDPALSEQDCMVTSDRGSIRGGSTTQLSRIRFAVRNQQTEAR